MKQVLCFSLLCLLYSCSDDKLAQSKDYDSYLHPKHLQQSVADARNEIMFWETRLAKDTGNFVNMLELGGNYLGMFKMKGEVADLHTGDSLMRRASAKLNGSDPSILQALSQVAITQHQFATAAGYNEEALNKNASPYTHALLSFDAGMETGDFREAKQQLGRFSNPASFDYLIRKAKYEDHLGNLDGAIEWMEAAFERAAASNKHHLYCWTLSNLADMYGHAGRAEEAYDAYLKVLAKDPSYLYALKGIAWIAYAHDKNTAEAKRIMQFITTHTNAPELYLTLAEIADYEGNAGDKEKYMTHFLSLAERPEYGAMYNKYLINVYLEKNKTDPKALKLALNEITSRPTPETYSWLAWVYYNRGNVREAHDIYATQVEGRTFEPDALLKGAYIFAASGRKAEAKKLFKECLQSSFELGPLTTAQARLAIKNLGE
jgi:tetratricopeptide (TPR) repeat protein